MATLVKQGARYYLQFYHKDRCPQRKKVTLKTNRKRSAKTKQRELEMAYMEGRFDPWANDPFSYDEPDVEALCVSEAVRRFLERKDEDGRSENTLRTYREVVGLFVDDVGSETPMHSISPTSLRAFIRQQSLSKATQHKRFGHLRTFFRWCKSESLLRESPLEDVEKPDKPAKLPKAASEDDLRRICNAVRTHYERCREKNWIREGEAIWRIPLFRFAFYTGMRGSELGRLRWKHLDFRKRLIYIRKQKNNKEQTIPLNKKAREILQDVRKGEDEDFVFRSPGFEAKERNATCFRNRASRAFRKARKQTGIERPISFHSLRHGFCTHLAEAGKPLHVIKEAARHADVSTSMIYVHMANEHLKAELDDVFG